MKGTPLTEETYNYIVDLFASRERAMLAPMSATAEAAGVPMIMISEEQARFIGFFVKAINATRVLDVGTLFGFSAAVIANAIGAQGSVLSLEFEKMHADVAQANLEALGITNVEVRVGAALDHMRTLPDNSFDMVLIDADKINYEQYLNESIRILRNGGIVAADNAFAFGKITDHWLPESDPDFVSVDAMRKFNQVFAEHPNLYACLVPVGDGLDMAVVQK